MLKCVHTYTRKLQTPRGPAFIYVHTFMHIYICICKCIYTACDFARLMG